MDLKAASGVGSLDITVTTVDNTEFIANRGKGEHRRNGTAAPRGREVKVGIH